MTPLEIRAGVPALEETTYFSTGDEIDRLLAALDP
jgi:hypothetical protein